MSVVPIQTKEFTRPTRAYLKSFSELYEKIASSQYLPPQAIEIEQSILGAMMLSPDAVSVASEVIGDRTLSNSPFYRDAHTAIYQAILSLDHESVRVDLLTTSQRLQKDGMLEEIGGRPYLVELTQKVVTTANVEAHARLIIEKYISREVIRVCEEMKLRSFVGEDDVFELLNKVEDSFFRLSESKHAQSVLNTNQLAQLATDDLRVRQDHTGDVTGVPAGLKDLDEITGGWQKTDLIILAARPSQGKTALALELARAAALQPVKEKRTAVAIFSLEMGAQQLLLRMLCAEADIDLQKARKGKLNDSEVVRIARAIELMKDAKNIYIDDTAGITPTELRAKCRRLVSKDKVGLVIVDYLQLMEAGKNMDSREREISYISRSLKKLAKELNVPVIALSQLNRQVESRSSTDKRPMLSDLRESGAIEQDADLVLFIYRPETYSIDVWDDNTPTKGTAEIIVGKQRNGPIGSTRVYFRAEVGRFNNLAVHVPLFNDRGGLRDGGDRESRDIPTYEPAF